MTANIDAATCSLPGDSDLYGLGIRIGVYTQLLSTLITNHFLPDDVSGNSTSNLIFLCALTLAIIRSIASGSGFLVVECFVTIQLLLAFFLMSTGGMSYGLADLFIAHAEGANLGNPSTKEQRREVDANSEESRVIFYVNRAHLSKLGQAYLDSTPLRRTFQWMLNLAAAILNFWLWLFGLGKLEHAPSGCNTYFFLFRPIRSSPSIRVFFAVLSTAYLVWWAMLFLVRMDPLSYGSVRKYLLEIFDPRPDFVRAAAQSRDGIKIK
jgi:hypothetical protein